MGGLCGRCKSQSSCAATGMKESREEKEHGYQERAGFYFSWMLGVNGSCWL